MQSDVLDYCVVACIVELGLHGKVISWLLIVKPVNGDLICVVHWEVARPGIVNLNLSEEIVIGNIHVIVWICDLSGLIFLGYHQFDVEWLRLIIIGTVGLEVQCISVLVAIVVEDLAIIVQESSLCGTFTGVSILIFFLEFWMNVEIDWILLQLNGVVIIGGWIRAEHVVLHWDNTSGPEMDV